MAGLTKKQRGLVNEAVRRVLANLGLPTNPKVQRYHEQKGNEEQAAANPRNEKQSSAGRAWIAGLTWIGLLIGAWSHSLSGVLNFFGGSPNILYPFAILSCVMVFAGANLLRLYFLWGWIFNASAVIGSITLLGLTHRYIVDQRRARVVVESQRAEEHTILTNIPDQFAALNSNLSKGSEKKPPGLPWMEIKTLAGLTGPTPGGTLTGEMQSTFRQHQLIIRNSNRVDLRNFSLDLRLPEPISHQIPKSIA